MDCLSPVTPRSVIHKRNAFTLIELLVVITIIGILAAMLFPVFGKIRERARRVTCLSNMKQFGIAFIAYAGEEADCFPYSGTPKPEWISSQMRDTLTNRYSFTRVSFYCPSNSDYNKQWEPLWGQGAELAVGFLYYGWKTNFPCRTTDQPANKILMSDLSRKWGGSWQGVAHPLTRGGAPEGGNHLFMDGSARWIMASEFIKTPIYSANGVDAFAKGNQ